MYIDRILVPVKSLGPGDRLAIWTKGCSKHCKGCANPELWDTSNARLYLISDIVNIIKNLRSEVKFEGITITGGDPLEQKDELLSLTSMLQNITDDVLVYTGYTFNELNELWSREEIRKLKASVAVLIDGPYIEKQNTSDAVLTGSNNQRIFFFKERYREHYEEYLKQGRKIQNIFMGDRLISVGIHDHKGE